MDPHVSGALLGSKCSVNPHFHPVMGGEAYGVPGGQFAVLSPEDIHTSQGMGTKVESGSACVPDNAVNPQKPGSSQRAQQRPGGEGDMAEPPSCWEKQGCDTQERPVSMRPSLDALALFSVNQQPLGAKSTKPKMEFFFFLKN